MSKSGAGALDPSIPVQRQAPDSADALTRAIADLDRLADGPLGVWRATLLARLDEVRELLVVESPGPVDWLEARRSVAVRERNVLLDRLTVQRHQVLGVEDVDRTSYEVRRLVADVRRHLQRLHDIAYDEVEFEAGGSE
ncbi:hypothetical protein [Nocardioides daphniae]|uniref:Uncharacterized protein n=1 Tax=Nocardioides daphniae TaxID=402297 RepID=A0A4P7UGQ3_9ACTN|nr:hypothetical protein [Nocardioides daphniae]QCC78408.1 hypothetical protein E2C04_16585 [Nocardioides daphniae]GGD12706.1 hypothetical protein GCM10007231_09650 [Nocardioides daphniae]